MKSALSLAVALCTFVFCPFQFLYLQEREVTKHRNAMCTSEFGCAGEGGPGVLLRRLRQYTASSLRVRISSGSFAVPGSRPGSYSRQPMMSLCRQMQKPLGKSMFSARLKDDHRMQWKANIRPKVLLKPQPPDAPAHDGAGCEYAAKRICGPLPARAG